MGKIIQENTDPIMSEEVNNKKKEYFFYINEHVNNVKKVYNEIMLPLMNVTGIIESVSDDEIKQAIISIKSDIEEHDSSKYSEEEFDAYRVNFHPTRSEQQADDDAKEIARINFEEAWKHHYENNDHHPNFWYDYKNKVSRDMSLGAIIHMLCDWEAMSMKFHTNTLEWFEKADKERNLMSDNTLKIVTELVNRLFSK